MRWSQEDLEAIETAVKQIAFIRIQKLPKNKYDYDDLLQAGRLGAFEALAEFDRDGKGNVKSFVWKPIGWAITHFIRSESSINWRLRKELGDKVPRRVSLHDDSPSGRPFVELLKDKRVVLMEGEIVERGPLETLLDTLSERNRMICTQRWLNEQDTSGIAADLNVDPSNIRWILINCKKKLKALLPSMDIQLS